MANKSDQPDKTNQAGKADKPVKPLLFSKPPRSDSALPRRLRDRMGSDYIPGYSEHVMANDLSQSETIATSVKEKYYQRDFGVGPKVLPVEFVWVRVTGPTGELSASADMDAYEYTKRGYKPVQLESKDQFGELFVGMKFPPAAQLAADGLVRYRDTALFYVDREVADRLEAERIEDNKRLLGHNQPGGQPTPMPYDFEVEDEYSRKVGSFANQSTKRN